MIKVDEKTSPEPRVFWHYWASDKHTDHLHTNPVCRGQYEKHYPLYFNHQVQRENAKDIRRFKRMMEVIFDQMKEQYWNNIPVFR